MVADSAVLALIRAYMENESRCLFRWKKYCGDLAEATGKRLTPSQMKTIATHNWPDLVGSKKKIYAGRSSSERPAAVAAAVAAADAFVADAFAAEVFAAEAFASKEGAASAGLGGLGGVGGAEEGAASAGGGAEEGAAGSDQDLDWGDIDWSVVDTPFDICAVDATPWNSFLPYGIERVSNLLFGTSNGGTAPATQ